MCLNTSVFGITSLQETEVHSSQFKGKGTREQKESPEIPLMPGQLALTGAEGLQAAPSTHSSCLAFRLCFSLNVFHIIFHI